MCIRDSLSYQALFNVQETRNADFAYRFNPDGLKKQHRTSLVHGLDWTHTLSDMTFLDVSLRQNYYNYRDMAFDDAFDSRYDVAGDSKTDDEYAKGAVIQGVDFG